MAAGKWLTRSVADEVVREAKVPVCLVGVRTIETVKWRQSSTATILVPLDGSQIAELVLPYVKTLACQWGAELANIALLMVFEPNVPWAMPGYCSDEQWKEDWDRWQSTSEQYLATIAERFQNTGLTVNSVTLFGRAADEVIKYAGGIEGSLIVMATHGCTGPKRWLFGSVADEVRLRSPRPLFLIGNNIHMLSANHAKVVEEEGSITSSDVSLYSRTGSPGSGVKHEMEVPT